MILNNLKKILKKDLKQKLLYLKYKTKINFYPDHFKLGGIPSLMTKLIFFLSMIEKFYREYRVKKNLLFKKQPKYFFIHSFPRSGTNYLKSILESNFELENNIGNGIPKYNQSTDNFIFADNFHAYNLPRLSSIVYKHLSINEIRNSHMTKRINLQKKFRFRFSHFPINTNDLISFNEQIKGVYLIRNPITCCFSYFLHTIKSENFFYRKNSKIKIDTFENQLKFIIKNYKIYINHISKYKKKIFIVRHEDLITNPLLQIKKIFKYFGYKYQLKNLKKSIIINKKKNLQKSMGDSLIYSNRYSLNNILSDKQKKILTNLIKSELKSEIEIYKKINNN